MGVKQQDLIGLSIILTFLKFITTNSVHTLRRNKKAWNLKFANYQLLVILLCPVRNSLNCIMIVLKEQTPKNKIERRIEGSSLLSFMG